MASPPLLTGRRAWAPALVLGAGCLLNLSVDAQREMALQAPLAALPRVIEDFRGTDLTINPDELAIAGTTSSLHRVYTRDSTAQFSVYVGYYDRQRQGQTIHSPKNCLPGAGWEPLESRREALPGLAGVPIQVNRFVIANKQQRALVYYWYQGRGRTESNEYRVKLDLIRDSALRRRSEEALVRIVLPLTGAEAETDALARRLVPQLHQELVKILPS